MPDQETRSPSPPTSASATGSTGRSPTSRNATPPRTSRTTTVSSKPSGPDDSQYSKASEHSRLAWDGGPGRHGSRPDHRYPRMIIRIGSSRGSAVLRRSEALRRRGKVMAPDRHARTMLPIPDRPSSGLTAYDAKDPDAAFPPVEPLLPPVGAPNVVIVLLDDVGFGASSAFGGPCRTPVAQRLAGGGLTYNRFHTTALCAPTRAAMLSGRNHHSVGMGSITET